MKSLTFANGDRMPIVGLGTWKAEPDDVYGAVQTALRLGYRHIDCAHIYGNEPAIGRALGEAFDAGVVGRQDLWITSKLWNDAHAPEDVRPALEHTLAALRLDYLDLYLMHWPVAFRKGVALPESADDFIPLAERPIAATWEAMERAREAGLCRHVGVSNFSVTKVASLLDTGVKPAVNQVEIHPYLQQRELVGFCQSRGIHVTAYSSLGSRDRPDRLKADGEPVLMEDAAIAAIAERRGATPAQVLLAWAIHRDIAVIPKSVNPGRMQENLAAVEVALAPQDLEGIAALNRDRRYVSGGLFTPPGSPYSVTSIWG